MKLSPKVNVNAKTARVSIAPEPKMSQINPGKGEKKSNGNGDGKTESEIIDEETLEIYTRFLQDFSIVTPTPAPTLVLDRFTPAPTPAPTMQTIAQIIENDNDLDVLECLLSRVSGTAFEFDFRLMFNGTFPFPFSRRNLRFQQDNPYRTNDIVNLLNQPGDDFTFFAPTDNALRNAFRQSNRLFILLFFYDDFLPHLEDFLLYHGLDEARFSSQLDNGDSSTTLNTERVGFRRTGGTLRVRGVTVVESDIGASNGVVHKINGLLLPAWVRNSLLDLTRMNSTGNLSILFELLVVSGLESALGGTIFDPIENPMPSSNRTQGLTLLAPTNEAFNALDSPVDLVFLRNSTNRAELERILRYHIVDPGVFTSPRLINGANLATASGDVVVSVVDEIVMFNQATVMGDNILANNGVLYVVNAVLNPPAFGG
jgi:uncharacterized surface protein with fasciclin (FAS1) repeats